MKIAQTKFGPYAKIILAAILLGTNGIFVKKLGLPATTLSFFRTVVPAVVVFFYLQRFLPQVKMKKLISKENRLMLFASFLNAVRMPLYYLGLFFTTVGNVVLAVFIWPVFASLLGRLFLKERVSRRNLFLLFLNFIGIVVIYLNKEFSLQNKDFLGVSVIVFQSFLYACTAVIFKKESANRSQFEIVFFQNFLGAFLFFPFIFINRPFPNISQSFVAIIYAVLVGIVCFGLFFSGLKQVKLANASMLTYLEVVSAIILSMIFFHEKLTWNMVLGGVLIISSAAFLKKGEEMRERK